MSKHDLQVLAVCAGLMVAVLVAPVLTFGIIVGICIYKLATGNVA